MSRAAASVDVSELPTSGFGPGSPAWWGTLGFMAIEGASLALCAGTYLYLAKNYEAWPPPGLPAPDLLIPTLSALALLAGVVPAYLVDRAAKRKDVAGVVKLLLVMAAGEVIMLGLRAFEFGAVNVWWDTNAYGSVIWFTLGLHTALLAVDLVETVVFALIFILGRVEEKHFADAADVAIYFNFLALAWLPLYLLIYVSPRVF